MMIELAPSYVKLSSWNIFINTTTDTEHFLGYDHLIALGRLSTAIQSYDPKTGIGVTESGSRYQTIGPAGQPHPDAIYVLEKILKNRLIDYKFKYQTG